MSATAAFCPPPSHLPPSAVSFPAVSQVPEVAFTLSFAPSVSAIRNSASNTPVFLPVSTTEIVLAFASN